MEEKAKWRKFSTIRNVCWAQGLSTPCKGRRSREHVVSASILRLVGPLKVTNRGATHFLDETNYKIKNLCAEHNSKLSEYDTEALKFYSSVYFALENRTPHPEIIDQITNGKVLIDGHKFEKWLAKTFINSIIYDYGAYQHNDPFFGGSAHSIVKKLYEGETFHDPFGLYVRLPSQNGLSYMFPQYTVGKRHVNGIWKNVPTPKFYSLSIYGIEMLAVFNTTNQSDEWFCKNLVPQQKTRFIENGFKYRDLRIKLPREDGNGMLEIEIRY